MKRADAKHNIQECCTETQGVYERKKEDFMDSWRIFVNVRSYSVWDAYRTFSRESFVREREIGKFRERQSAAQYEVPHSTTEENTSRFICIRANNELRYCCVRTRATSACMRSFFFTFSF